MSSSFAFTQRWDAAVRQAAGATGTAKDNEPQETDGKNKSGADDAVMGLLRHEEIDEQPDRQPLGLDPARAGEYLEQAASRRFSVHLRGTDAANRFENEG